MFIIGDRNEFLSICPLDEWVEHDRMAIPVSVDGIKGFFFVNVVDAEKNWGCFVSPSKTGAYVQQLNVNSSTGVITEWTMTLFNDYFSLAETGEKSILRVSYLLAGLRKYKWSLHDLKKVVDSRGSLICRGIFNIKELVAKAEKLTDEDILYRFVSSNK